MKTLDIPILAADPVISEVRRAKTAVGQKYGFDVLAMVRSLRELDEQDNANKPSQVGKSSTDSSSSTIPEAAGP